MTNAKYNLKNLLIIIPLFLIFLLSYSFEAEAVLCRSSQGCSVSSGNVFDPFCTYKSELLYSFTCAGGETATCADIPTPFSCNGFDSVTNEPESAYCSWGEDGYCVSTPTDPVPPEPPVTCSGTPVGGTASCGDGSYCGTGVKICTSSGEWSSCGNYPSCTWVEYCTGGDDPNGNDWQIWAYTAEEPRQWKYVEPGTQANGCAPPTNTGIWGYEYDCPSGCGYSGGTQTQICTGPLGVTCSGSPQTRNCPATPSCGTVGTWYYPTACPTACGYSGGTQIQECSGDTCPGTAGTRTCSATSPCPTGTWVYPSACPTACGYPGGTQTEQCVGGNGSCSGGPDSRTCSATSPCAALYYPLNVIKAGLGKVKSSNGAINCGSGCVTQTKEFEVDTVVTLTAQPDEHRIFTGWSGSCSGLGSCSVLMNSAKTVYANFAVDPDYKEF